MTEQSLILDLASRFDGYMVQFDQTIADMIIAGLITTAYACEGFVIVHAVRKPTARRNGFWIRQLRAGTGQFGRFEQRQDGNGHVFTAEQVNRQNAAIPYDAHGPEGS